VMISPFYMRDFYDLRGHIDLIQDRLRRHQGELLKGAAAAGPSAGP
jgi:hypothetical protein